MPDRIIGCPHEEDIDYDGEYCPEVRILDWPRPLDRQAGLVAAGLAARCRRRYDPAKIGKETPMSIDRMLTEEEPVAELVGRVLQEAGIEFVFGISGGHTGRIVGGLRKIQNSLRMVMVREESLAGVMAEVYGRLTRRPGVLIGQGPGCWATA